MLPPTIKLRMAVDEEAAARRSPPGKAGSSVEARILHREELPKGMLYTGHVLYLYTNAIKVLNAAKLIILPLLKFQDLIINLHHLLNLL